jgi:hypothetical protein
MKNLIDLFIVVAGFALLVGISKDLSKKDKKSVKHIVHHSVSTNQVETKEVNPVNEEHTETIIIKGLGDVDQDDKLYASNVIKNFYGYNCIIEDNIDFPSNLHFIGSVIDAEKSIYEFNDDVKTIYLTNNRLREGDLELRGYTTIYGKSILVKSDKRIMKETILHEIGHTLGLEHCDNLSCIMATSNDEYETGKFCKSCKSKINI